MVYCGSGTETNDDKFFIILFHDPMVYCGSGTETQMVAYLFVFFRSYGLLRKRY